MQDAGHLSKTECLSKALSELIDGNEQVAEERLKSEYPFEPITPVKRTWSHRLAVSIFERDGYIDRYFGNRLVFPGALRVLSVLLPDVFPSHPNWKMSATHIAYWELFPTLDHIIPVTQGGTDTDANLVTTSMIHNQAKSNSTLEALGWSLHPPGDMDRWDGLVAITLEVSKYRPELLRDPYLSKWVAASDHSGGDQA